jgi:hypothetical protein
MRNKEEKRSLSDCRQGPRTLHDEIGMSLFYLAERLCYRVAFLLSGACNRRVLDAADYSRAGKERLANFRRGLREDGPPSGAKK